MLTISRRSLPRKTWALAAVSFFLAFGLLVGRTPAADKLSVATASKRGPHYYLTFEAGRELGYWKERGLEVTWVPLDSAAQVFQGLAADAVNVGMAGTLGGIQAIARGVPVILIYDELRAWPNGIFVLADSPIRDARELKRAKIGIVRYGGMNHAYGVQMMQSLALEKEIKFVATGGAAATIAALKARNVDAIIQTVEQMVNLIARNEVRQIMSSKDALPPEWSDLAAFAKKDYLETNADKLTRWARAMDDAQSYIVKNPEWSLRKMKADLGLLDEAARQLYAMMDFVKGGRVSPRAVENVKNFLVRYGIIPKEKAPPLEALYTSAIAP